MLHYCRLLQTYEADSQGKPQAVPVVDDGMRSVHDPIPHATTK